MKTSLLLSLLLAMSVHGQQVPNWSKADIEFFLHGSMGTEVLPERVLQAFVVTYPDLFPKKDLSNFGLIPDGELPVGVSRRPVPHLGGLSSIGVNCAACHVGEINVGKTTVRVLGVTSHFDAEAFFGAAIIATFRTSDPANMKRYLEAYLAADTNDLATATAEAQLKLFHDMRAALHVPEQPPPASPPNGPGRNDPWRILSYSLLGVVTKPAPVKFGIVWNEDQRTWVHVDGNTRSPIIRNLAASLGLGAPLVGHTGVLDFAKVERHTALSESIRPPKYPSAIDRTAVDRGAKTYKMNCAACHDGPQNDQRLHSVAEIKTDPNRAEIFTTDIAEQFNKFFAELEIPGYRPPEKPLRGTQKYWAPDLAGVWARSPYLHNGSVRTMRELLMPPADRAKSFHRGSRDYDVAQMGFKDEGTYVLDTTAPGSSNAGHDYGTALTDDEKRDLIEFLKSL